MDYEWEDARPDILTVGKAMSGGMMPVSAALCNDHIMGCIKPGDHGSTYGGNPLAMKVSKRAVEVLIEEGMIENANVQGEFFR